MMLIRAAKGRHTVHLAREQVTFGRNGRYIYLTLACGDVMGQRVWSGKDDEPRCKRCATTALRRA